MNIKLENNKDSFCTSPNSPKISTYEGSNQSLEKDENYIKHITELTAVESKNAEEVLNLLLEQVQPVNFVTLAFPETGDLLDDLAELKRKESSGSATQDDLNKIEGIKNHLGSYKLQKKHYLISTIESLRDLTVENKWGFATNNGSTFVYNGSYWIKIEQEKLRNFLGVVAEKMGVPHFEARFYFFRDQLLKQFLSVLFFDKSVHSKSKVLINLMNGTCELSDQGVLLRNFDPNDFLTYQLPFYYNEKATAPIFIDYLKEVQPDEQRQIILSEFIGSIFIPTSKLKLEKALLLYGSGANGKSVFFDVINALLGPENISSFSMHNLTDNTGYYRAKFANHLLNYTSEISGNLESSYLKQLISGEPVEARLPYGEPFQLTNYGKLAFNCNELPWNIEHTSAYFRRFLIVEFDVRIPEEQQDRELAQKIIATELSGVFNWVIEGLKKLLEQKSYSACEAALKAVKQYERESNTVLLFIEEEGYIKSSIKFILISDIYREYQSFCTSSGQRTFSKTKFRQFLEDDGFFIERKDKGKVVYLEK